jgi:zinc protease
MKKIFSCIILMATLVAAGFCQKADGPKEFTVDGIKVIYKPSIKEISSVRLFIKGGTANFKKEEEGIEALALAVATQGGTKSMTKTEFATALEKIGTTIGTSSSLDYSEVNLSCINTYWNDSWKLFADAIANPRFDPKEFDLIKGQLVAGAKESEANPDAHLVTQSLQNTFAGKNYSKKATGTAASLEKLTLDQTQKYYSSLIGKQNAFIVVVGNIDEADLKTKISTAFKNWGPGKTVTPEKPADVKPEATIENREIATNYIRGLMPSPPRNSKEGVSMRLATAIMYDRFFVELRTKRSLSYAPQVSYASSAITNPYTVFYISTIDPKQSLQVMMDQINDVKNKGFTEKELKDMKESYLTGHYMGLETNSSQTFSLGTSEVAGDWKKSESFMQDVEKATVQDLNAVFKKYSSSINWTYLGKADAVTKDDFKQPQLIPENAKISPKK